MQNSDPGSRQQQAEMNMGDGMRDTVRRETQSAREALHDARDEVTRKAREYASEAKNAAVDQAETAQRDVGASLVAFGGALRAAGDHLAGSNQDAASKMIRQAADGVERFAGSLKNKPVADVIEDMRSFGRENSGMLFAGSLLAGLAIGRLVKSSAPARRPTQPASPEEFAGREEGQAGLFGEFPETPAGGQDFPSAGQDSSSTGQDFSSTGQGLPSSGQETYRGPITRSSGYE